MEDKEEEDIDELTDDFLVMLLDDQGVARLVFNGGPFDLDCSAKGGEFEEEVEHVW